MTKTIHIRSQIMQQVLRRENFFSLILVGFWLCYHHRHLHQPDAAVIP